MLNYLKFKVIRRLGMHLVFWLFSLGFFWLLFSRNSKDVLNTAIFMAILSPVAIITTYFFNYRLIPRFLIKGEYFRFVWYSSITAVLGLWLAMMGGIFIWMWRAEFNLGDINNSTIDLFMLVATLFFVVLMGISAKLIRINFQIQIEKNTVENEKLMLDNQLRLNELKFLKEQLNPHFLFNTLNNLYGLTLEKSDKAPGLVMSLSKMLDYMLYRTTSNIVPLLDEIEMIQNYIAIEQLRFEGQIPISFNIIGECANLKIAPLIFLPLVENCFKHGVRKTIRGEYVNIEIQIANNSVIFKTSNSKLQSDYCPISGIGLDNLKKRLAMIYPQKHRLSFHSEENKFETILYIQLS